MNDEHTAELQKLINAGGPGATALTALLMEYSDYKGRALAMDKALDGLMAQNDQLRAAAERDGRRNAIPGWGVWHADDEEWIGWAASRKLATNLIPDSPEYEHLKIREATALIVDVDQETT